MIGWRQLRHGCIGPATRSPPLTTITRLLGGVAIVAIGCWTSTLFSDQSKGFVVVVASVGSAMGHLYAGPRGAVLGASVLWLIMGGILIIAAIFFSAYLFLFG